VTRRRSTLRKWRHLKAAKKANAAIIIEHDARRISGHVCSRSNGMRRRYQAALNIV